MYNMSKKYKLTNMTDLELTATAVADRFFRCDTYERTPVAVFPDGKEYVLSDKKQIRAFLDTLQEQLDDANKTIYAVANTEGSDTKIVLDTVRRTAEEYIKKWSIK